MGRVAGARGSSPVVSIFSVKLEARSFSRGWEKGNARNLREGGNSFPENGEMSGVGL